MRNAWPPRTEAAQRAQGTVCSRRPTATQTDLVGQCAQSFPPTTFRVDPSAQNSVPLPCPRAPEPPTAWVPHVRPPSSPPVQGRAPSQTLLCRLLVPFPGRAGRPVASSYVTLPHPFSIPPHSSIVPRAFSSGHSHSHEHSSPRPSLRPIADSHITHHMSDAVTTASLLSSVTLTECRRLTTPPCPSLARNASGGLADD